MSFLSTIKSAFTFGERSGKKSDIFGGEDWLSQSAMVGLLAGRGGEIPIVSACIDIMVDAMTTADIQVVRNDGNLRNEQYIPVSDHPLRGLLMDPNEEWDSHRFWSHFYRSFFRDGNAYAYIRRHGVYGRAVELLPARGPSRDGGIIRQINVYEDGKWWLRRVDRAADVLDLHFNDGAEFDSISPIMRANTIIDLIMGIVGYNINVITKGLHFKTVIQPSEKAGDFSQAQMEQIKQNVFEYMNRNSTQSARFLFMNKGIEIKQLFSTTSKDMEIASILNWAMMEICRVWRVPPHLVYHAMERKQFAADKLGASEQGEIFYRQSLMPHFKRIESLFTRRLLVKHEKAAGRYRVLMSADEIRHGAWRDKAEVTQLLVTRGGLLTINEGRGILGFDPIEDGDRLINPTGTVDQTDEGGMNSEDENKDENEGE